MSAERHTPAERAAFRQALNTLAIALRQYHPASEVIGAFLESDPALPPLPVIERWVTTERDGSVPSYYGSLEDAKDCLGHRRRLFRLEAVEEVTPTPTPEPVRVTLNGEVWERVPNGGWHSTCYGFIPLGHSNLGAALDRIAQLEAGR